MEIREQSRPCVRHTYLSIVRAFFFSASSCKLQGQPVGAAVEMHTACMTEGFCPVAMGPAFKVAIR